MRLDHVLPWSEREKADAELVELRTRLDLLAEIKTLRGILLICAYCQKIRDDQNVWMALEAYLHAHADTRLSHGICPECLEEEMKKSNT